MIAPQSEFDQFQGYPYTRDLICKEASQDIPPYFRGEIWAALLNVQDDVKAKYVAIDKETTISTDRQVDAN